MTGRRLADSPREERVRVITRAALRTGVVDALLLVGYATVPISSRASVGTVIWLAVFAIGFIALLVLQVRAIVQADYPQVRAASALAFIIVLFLVVYALIYVTMSSYNSEHFSEPLSRVDAMYLTMTIFATVGFGDIVPITSPARIVASIQMLLDLVLLGVIVRLLFGASKVGLRRGTTQ